MAERAVMSMKGESAQMTVPVAVEMIRATPPARRSQFGKEIRARRREHGTDSKRAVLSGARGENPSH
jgi:hypothetical protein